MVISTKELTANNFLHDLRLTLEVPSDIAPEKQEQLEKFLLKELEKVTENFVAFKEPDAPRRNMYVAFEVNIGEQWFICDNDSNTQLYKAEWNESKGMFDIHTEDTAFSSDPCYLEIQDILLGAIYVFKYVAEKTGDLESREWIFDQPLDNICVVGPNLLERIKATAIKHGKISEMDNCSVKVKASFQHFTPKPEPENLWLTRGEISTDPDAAE